MNVLSQHYVHGNESFISTLCPCFLEQSSIKPKGFNVDVKGGWVGGEVRVRGGGGMGARTRGEYRF